MPSLPSAFRVVRAALADVWGDLWLALVCDFLWLLALLLVIPGPPATLALFSYANRTAHGETVDLSDFWRTFRHSWGPGWRWGVVNFAVIFIFVGDIYLTGRGSPTAITPLIQGFYFTCLGIWLLIQLYALPFLLEQEKPSLRTALRNAAVLFGRNIGFSLFLGIMLLLICLLGTLLFFLSLGFGGMFLAAAGNRAVLDRLEVQSSGV
ncbi:MAG: DUF624 domain-containing protein [Anaerolineaceae bacterium]|nr:DUF624 domain-containing protein [Anaerolineaceae bacterium]